MVITQEEGPSPAEQRDLERIQQMCGAVTVCRDGDEDDITDKVAEIVGS
jgi:hypothetical protein